MCILLHVDVSVREWQTQKPLIKLILQQSLSELLFIQTIGDVAIFKNYFFCMLFSIIILVNYSRLS